MTKKVLHIFGIMNRGGAELRTLSTMEYMTKRGISYDFLVLSGMKGVLDDEIIAKGGKIHYCKLGIRFLYIFSNVLRYGKYDVLHSHVSLASGLMIFIAWLYRIKIRIAHFRSTKDVENPSIIRQLRDVILRKIILLFSTNIVGVCRASLDAFWADKWKYNSKFKVIYNGFTKTKLEIHEDFWKEYIPNYSGQKILINVARMDEPKNHPRIVEVFSEFCRKDKDTLLVFVGKEDPRIKNILQSISSREHIEHRIHYMNEQNHVMPFITHSNLMFFPSKWEGLPGAVIESINAGTKVLGSEIPGIIEISNHMNFVTPFSLVKKNEQWAKKIDEILSIDTPKLEIKDQFDQSIFQAKHNLEQIHELYTIRT